MYWLILLISFAIGIDADVANLPDDDFFRLWTQSQIFIYQNRISHQNSIIGYGNLLTAKHVLTATSTFMKLQNVDGDFLKPDVDKYIFVQVCNTSNYYLCKCP